MKMQQRSFHEIHNDLEGLLMKAAITPVEFNEAECEKLKEEVIENTRLTPTDRQVLITLYNRIQKWNKARKPSIAGLR